MENNPNKIIIHHTDNNALYQFAATNTHHRDVKRFPESQLGYFGGYHYLIEKDGRFFQYRLETEIGAHDQGENINSIGIALAGNFNKELPTKEQEKALAALLEKIITHWKIPIQRIEPHRWGDSTDCPGWRLQDTWAQQIYLKYKISWIQKILMALMGQLPKR